MADFDADLSSIDGYISVRMLEEFRRPFVETRLVSRRHARMRTQRGSYWNMLKDFTVAIRQFRRQPGFALAVIATLALATGASIAVFSVVNAVLFRALPFQDPEQLVWITSSRPDNPAAPFSLPEFMDYRARTRTLSGLAAYIYWRANFTGTGKNEGFQGARISANAFKLLGTRPVVGRLLRDSDDLPNAPRVVVLSYQLWQRRFSGAVRVVGSSIRLNGDSFVVVGVVPPHFPLPLRDVEVFTPLVPDLDRYRYVRSSTNFLRFIGRLSPRVSRTEAQAELITICDSLRQQFPIEYARKRAVRTIDLHEALIGDYRQSMLLLFAAVLVVLGTALANLSSLVLVRANARRAELTIRVALGASRLQLIRQLLIESLLLALTGTVCGWAFARWFISVAMRWVPTSIPRLTEVGIDGKVLGFAGLMVLASTVLLTVAAFSAVMKAQAGDVLRSSRGTVGDRWSSRVRQALVTSEISAALILVLAAMVLLKNILYLEHLHPGFDAGMVFQVRLSLPPAYRSPNDVARFYDRLSERLQIVPGVEKVGVTSIAPLSGLVSTVPFKVEGDAQLERDLPNVNLRAISPGYLAAVGSRLLNGRSFSEMDRPDTVQVALVSSALSRRYLNNAPLGRRLLIRDNSKGPRPVEVVGVVEDVRQSALDTPPDLDVYIPLRQVHPEHAGELQHDQFWMIRTATPPAAFLSSFVSSLGAVDTDTVISSAGTMRDYVEAALGPRRFNLGLFGAFSLSGVLLALLGVYALISHAVVQRHQEIGVRMAVGATDGDIQRMILRQATLLGLAGLVLGCCAASIAHPLLSRFAPEASLTIPPAMLCATFLLGLVILAAWVPARRAVRISPTVALRGD